MKKSMKMQEKSKNMLILILYLWAKQKIEKKCARESFKDLLDAKMFHKQNYSDLILLFKLKLL